LTPNTPAELAPAYDYGAGSIRMDLTRLDFEDADLATTIDMGAGEVIVIVPADVDVAVDGAVVIGDLMLFNRQTSGFDANDAFTDLGADGLGGGQLDLSIDLGLGKVEVRRATS
jgi:predicted membrane protein